jgi:hypothetical protein
MKNKLSEISSFRSEKVEKMIAEGIAEMNEFAKNLGINLAEKRLPEASGGKLISVIGVIKAKAEKLCISVCKELQSAVHFPEVNTDKLNVNAETKRAQEAINELKFKNNNTEAEQKKLNVHNIYRNVREMRIKSFLLFAAEAFFASLSFQFFGESLLVSILIAIPFTMAVSEYSHLVADQYKKYQNPLKRRVFLLLATLFASLVFFGLSYFRSQALGKEGFSIGTLFFVMINLFIFLVSSFLHYKYSPSKEETLKFHAHKKLKEEIDGRKAEMSQIIGHINELDAKLNEKAKLAIQVDHYAKNCIEEIKVAYAEAVGNFKNTNIMLRKDNAIPENFSEPIPELEIKYDFDLYKSKPSEN